MGVAIAGAIAHQRWLDPEGSGRPSLPGEFGESWYGSRPWLYDVVAVVIPVSLVLIFARRCRAK